MGIQAAFIQQSRMRTFFNDTAMIDNDDLVCIANRAQAVGNDDRGTAFHQPFQCYLNDFFRFRIESRRGFIENQNARIF